ncbi:hypothetical protein MP228_000084 [Amoeboaphelidium protococcarum]|nr:hypothetical protein MP228_000084 [Amoeboaphelidium protococcarum]
MSDQEDEFECPLCMEEIDFTDRNFKPCPCGREYRDEDVEYRPPSLNEIQAYKVEKKKKEKEKKEMEGMSRRHLANLRVVRRNLVYVVGLSPQICTEDILRSYEYFGQYGRILKIVVNKKSYGANQSDRKEQHSYGVYITYARKEDAARCIQTVDGTVFEGKVLRASYGTTKYCTYYLRGLTCQNSGCFYLHEPGDSADSFTKEEMASGKHHVKQNNQGPNAVGGSGSPTSGIYQNTNYAIAGSQQLQQASSNQQQSVLLNADGQIVNGQPAPFGINAPDKSYDISAAIGNASDSPQIGNNNSRLSNPRSAGVDPQEEWPAVTAAAASSSTTSLNRPSQSSASQTKNLAWGQNVKSTLLAQSNGMNQSSGIQDQTLYQKQGDQQQQGLVEVTDGDGVSCSTLLEMIMTGRSRNPVEPVINTSSLHRYLFLAQQAKEYYTVLLAQAQNSGDSSGQVKFAFDPFKNDSSNQSDQQQQLKNQKDRVQTPDKNGGSKSRFDFVAQSQSSSPITANNLGGSEYFDASSTQQSQPLSFQSWSGAI